MNEQLKNLAEFIALQKITFERQLKSYHSEGLMNWNDNQWPYGEKGRAWLREGGNGSLHFASVRKIKGLNEMLIAQPYLDFMRAVIISETFSSSSIPSGTALDKRLNVLRRWYYEMVTLTGQTHPMYLTTEIINAAMKRHADNSVSLSNVSDYCDIAVRLAKRIQALNLVLTTVECYNLYPCRNPTQNTKKRKIVEMNGEFTDDEKLITIRTFMCITEMIFIARTDGEKIFLNFMLLLIVTGFRFREVQTLRLDALVKRQITDQDKLEHAKKYGLPQYSLGIKYLGAKKSGWRIHWLAHSTIPLIESIFAAVDTLTLPYRSRLKQYRSSGFTDFLPPRLQQFANESIEVSDLENLIFSGSGGTRGNGGFRRSMVSSLNNHGIGIKPIHIEEISKAEKRFYFSKSQINQFVAMRYQKLKSFEKGYECTLVVKENGSFNEFKYEDLLFIAPLGVFGLGKDLIVLSNPVPIDTLNIRAWLGSDPNRKSIFEKLNMTEDDGKRISMGTHVPRHNINTFLAIADVTDHLQAMLMGRVDITQNIHYQHMAESQSYKAASLSAMMLEPNSAIDMEMPPLVPPKQQNSHEVRQSNQLFENRISALANIATNSISGKDFLKKTGILAVDPKLNIENNLKTNLQTYGGNSREVATFIHDSMSETFLSELKNAHTHLMKIKKENEAKELIERHSMLHSLKIGACTRHVGRWGCPFAMKCQSGNPCGYFTLTGHPGELMHISALLQQKMKNVQKLEMMTINDPAFELTLKEEREALAALEGFERQAYVSFKDKRLISLLELDKHNPLAPVIKRIKQQMVTGKTPHTLADLFFIEHKRKKHLQIAGELHND
ncbi:TPA: hypothetical protein ACJI8U_001527 [Morganella morganii]